MQGGKTGSAQEKRAKKKKGRGGKDKRKGKRPP